MASTPANSGPRRFGWPWLLALALSACSLLPTATSSSATFVPNVVGVVVDVTIGTQDVQYTVAGGRRFSISQSGFRIPGSDAKRDDLLIAGLTPEPWMTWASSNPTSAQTPSGCFALYGKATASETHVFQTVSSARGDVTIVLPKAASWVDQGADASGSLSGAYTCVNAEGEAFARVY